MNKSMFIGRLVKDPELTETKNETKVCRFTLAVSKRYDRKKCDFIACVAFGKQADYISGYAKKGMLVYVEGNLNTYQKPNTNPPVYGWNIEVTDFEILSTKKDMEEYNNKDELENAPKKSYNKPKQQLIEDNDPNDLSNFIPF